MLINFSYSIRESVLLWKVAARAAEFPFPSQQTNTEPDEPHACYVGLVGVRGSWAATTAECGTWRRLRYAYVSSFLDWWLGKYHTRLHHFTLAAILALEFEEKRECVEKRERQGYEGPGDGKLAHYQSSPCFSGAVFKYCCALCHCFTKAIMLSSLRRHHRQRAPTIYCTTTTASMKACSWYVQRNGSGYLISPP